MHKKYQWPVRVFGKTYGSNLKPVRMDRLLEGLGKEPLDIVLEAFKCRKDKGYPFLGDSVMVVTCIGQITEVCINPDDWRLLEG